MIFIAALRAFLAGATTYTDDSTTSGRRYRARMSSSNFFAISSAAFYFCMRISLYDGPVGLMTTISYRGLLLRVCIIWREPLCKDAFELFYDSILVKLELFFIKF